MVPHCGPSIGYRIEVGGTVIVYVSDHQEPVGRPDVVDPAVLELCRAADVLIHDGQYTRDEFELRPDWGHCTLSYAVEVAAQAGVDQLVLFHHDPGHDDDRLDELTEATAKEGAGRVGSVIAAYEGLSLTF
jgi:ribonuclease BN (tRNA processing enzyme)